MWVLYSYDVGSINIGTETFGFPVPLSYAKANYLTYNDLVHLLDEFQAHLNDESVISMYDNETGAYKNIDKNAEIELEIDKDIELRIKRNQLSEIGHLNQKVLDLENDVKNLVVQGSIDDLTEPENKKNAEIIDIAMMYAAPLILREGAIKVKECDD